MTPEDWAKYVERLRKSIPLDYIESMNRLAEAASAAVMRTDITQAIESISHSVADSNVTGGYDCPLVTSDGMPALKNENGTTDRRGALKLDTPLTGTHSTPMLGWQRRYPHVDGFILPWTRAGALRQGLSFYGGVPAGRARGTCSRGSEQTATKAALRCFSDVQWNPCFAPTADWDHSGTIVACASPGSTSFSRFVIVRRSSRVG